MTENRRLNRSPNKREMPGISVNDWQLPPECDAYIAAVGSPVRDQRGELKMPVRLLAESLGRESITWMSWGSVPVMSAGTIFRSRFMTKERMPASLISLPAWFGVSRDNALVPQIVRDVFTFDEIRENFLVGRYEGMIILIPVIEVARMFQARTTALAHGLFQPGYLESTVPEKWREGSTLNLRFSDRVRRRDLEREYVLQLMHLLESGFFRLLWDQLLANRLQAKSDFQRPPLELNIDFIEPPIVVTGVKVSLDAFLVYRIEEILLENWEIDLILCHFNGGVAGVETEGLVPPKAKKGVSVHFPELKILSDDPPHKTKKGIPIRIANPIMHDKRIRIMRFPLNPVEPKQDPPLREIMKAFKGEPTEEPVTTNRRNGIGPPAKQAFGVAGGSGSPLLKDLQSDDGLKAVETAIKYIQERASSVSLDAKSWEFPPGTHLSLCRDGRKRKYVITAFHWIRLGITSFAVEIGRRDGLQISTLFLRFANFDFASLEDLRPTVEQIFPEAIGLSGQWDVEKLQELSFSMGYRHLLLRHTVHLDRLTQASPYAPYREWIRCFYSYAFHVTRLTIQSTPISA